MDLAGVKSLHSTTEQRDDGSKCCVADSNCLFYNLFFLNNNGWFFRFYALVFNGLSSFIFQAQMRSMAISMNGEYVG